MPTIGDLFRNPTTGPVLIPGRIKAGPDSESEEVYVIVDKLDQRFEWGPYAWRPRGNDWPSRGDVALLAGVGSQTFLLDWWPRP